jgi:hypothetical protein
MKKTLKFSLFFAIFCFLLSCHTQKVFSERTLPDEDKLPKLFNENIIKDRVIYFEYKDSNGLLIKDKAENDIFYVLEHEKEYTSLGDVQCWVVFNYKTGIQELIDRITNSREVGLVGAVNLVINGRVESGDMNLEAGKVIDDDLFRVSGRANYLLKEITGEDFGSAGMYTTDKELQKLQRKWISWYNRLCEKK